MPAVCTGFLRLPLRPPIAARREQPLLHACCLHGFFASAIATPNCRPQRTATFACLLFARVFCVCHCDPQLPPAENSHFCMPAVCTGFLRLPLRPPIAARR